MATVPRSPTVQRYYPAWSPRQDIPPNLVLEFLAGLDVFFGLPGQPPANLDWPGPRRAEHPTSARSWLFGTDQIPGNISVTPTNIDPRSPTYTRYYPQYNPRNDQPPNIALTLLSAGVAATEPFNQFDWPRPKVTPPFYPTHSLSMLALAIGNPFTPIIYPLPRVAEHPTSARTWIQQPLCLVGQDVQFDGPGFGKSYDYPLPQLPQFPPGNRGFVNSSFALTFQQDKFFTAGAPVYDYPLPRRPEYPIANRTWINQSPLTLNPGLTGTTAFFTVGGPVYDYPLPRQPQYPVANRTWINTFNRNLIGKDTFFGVPGQPPANLDWPQPRRAQHPTSARTWTDSRLDSVFAPTPAPIAFDLSASITAAPVDSVAATTSAAVNVLGTVSGTLDSTAKTSATPVDGSGTMTSAAVTVKGTFV